MMASSPQIVVSDVSCNILNKVIYFKVIRLDDSLFVWVGSSPILSNMAVAMPANYDNLNPSSILFGGKIEHTSESLAKRLAKKLNKQVFVSCSVQYDQYLSVLIEKALISELDKLSS